MEVIITRDAYTDQGTFGSIHFADASFRTLELPWRHNAQMKSCIPVGTYVCKFTYSPRFKRKTYEILGVPNRSAVRIHPANFAGDTSLGFRSELNGCIAIGSQIQVVTQAMLLASRASVAKFERLLSGQDFNLTIRNSL